MRNIKLLLEYDGTRYDGFRPSKSRKDSLTVVEKLSSVLERMAGSEVAIYEAARTEAGVHALGQAVNFHIDSDKKPYEIKNYLNQYLPQDIAVLLAVEVPERFHCTLAPKRITYEYRIGMGEVESVFDRRYQYFSFKRLDVAAMKQAAEYLVGRHDFGALSGNRKLKKSTVREFYELEIYGDINEASITMTADDFWPGLARFVAGALIEVGKGLRTPESVAEFVGDAGTGKNARSRGKEARGSEGDTAMALPEKAEARGLFLAEVEYL